MAYLKYLAVALIIYEGFALVHHASLAWRRRAAARLGQLDSVATTQSQLVWLNVLAVCITLAAVGIRALRGLDATIVVWYGWMLPAMLLTAGVYWRYPQAAPVAVSQPDWDSQRLMNALRYFWAVAATVFAGVALVVLLVGT